MKEYEKNFLEHIAKLRLGGPDFAAMTRRALEAKFGGGGDVLLDGLDGVTLETPEKFANVMLKRFGLGAMEFYGSIVKFGESGLFHPGEPSPLEGFAHPLGSSPGANRQVALHEHRIKDEEDNYAEPP